MKVLIALVFVFNFCFANIGQITALVGNASIDRSGEVILATLGLNIENKDIIKTQKNSKLQIIFTDNTIVTVGKNSALDINDYLYDEKNPKNSKTNLNFFKGSFKTITGQIGKINRKKFNLKTKTASIGIRGTFIVGNQDMVACIQGGIRVENAGVFVDVAANEFTKTEKNKAPTTPKKLTQKSLQKLHNNIDPSKEESSQGEPEIQNILSNISTVANLLNEEEKREKILEAIEENKIDDIGNIEQKLSFEGKVQGHVYSLGDDDLTNIIQDATNKVSLNFDIGGGVTNMTGIMRFKSDIDNDSHSNVFTYDLSSSTANLNDNKFSVKAEHKNFETEYEFDLTGNSESVQTTDTVNLTEECVNGYTHKANITFEAIKK